MCNCNLHLWSKTCFFFYPSLLSNCFFSSEVAVRTPGCQENFMCYRTPPPQKKTKQTNPPVRRFILNGFLLTVSSFLTVTWKIILYYCRVWDRTMHYQEDPFTKAVLTVNGSHCGKWESEKSKQQLCIILVEV